MHDRCSSKVETGTFPTKGALASPSGAEGLRHIMSDAREATIATSRGDSSTAQRTSVTW